MPRRMIDLRPVSPLQSPLVSRAREGRRSSGGSVKELIENFENMRNEVSAVDTRYFERPHSRGGNLRNSKPIWKP